MTRECRISFSRPKSGVAMIRCGEFEVGCIYKQQNLWMVSLEGRVMVFMVKSAGVPRDVLNRATWPLYKTMRDAKEAVLDLLVPIASYLSDEEAKRAKRIAEHVDTSREDLEALQRSISGGLI
jgi:hypothetical protein